ncbi:MAG: uridine kinase [Patescibacteria group bacterium]|nr:MAG: uridine kinase [Patescibacteria group bacterium]
MYQQKSSINSFGLAAHAILAKMRTPFIIGVAGGSGSGKTTLSNEIRKSVPKKFIEHIPHDAYYRDQTHIPMEKRFHTNYDHPDSLETDLLIKHIKQLKKGKSVQRPTYDFTNHNRSKETVLIEPKQIILIEGILIFADEQLRKQINMKIFVDTDGDLRLARRLVRDVAERGRTFEQGIEQYLLFTKPMHEQFVEPSKRFADIIIPEGGFNAVATQMIQSQITAVLKNAKKK